MNATCDSFEMTLAEPDFSALGGLVHEQRSLLMASVALGLLSSIVALITYFGMMLNNWVQGRLYTVVEIRQHDQLYQWLLNWLAAQKEVHETGTRIFGELHPEFHKCRTAKSTRELRIRFLPIDDGSMYGFSMYGAFLWVSHVVVNLSEPRKGGSIQTSERRLRVTVLGRSKQAVDALFQAAYQHNKATLGGRTEIFVAQPHEQAEHSHWRRLEPRQNRPLRTVVSPDVIAWRLATHCC